MLDSWRPKQQLNAQEFAQRKPVTQAYSSTRGVLPHKACDGCSNDIPEQVARAKDKPNANYLNPIALEDNLQAVLNVKAAQPPSPPHIFAAYAADARNAKLFGLPLEAPEEAASLFSDPLPDPPAEVENAEPNEVSLGGNTNPQKKVGEARDTGWRGRSGMVYQIIVFKAFAEGTRSV
ncbi:MAG: hypothetical protein Q9186_007258 [Xanthomendoza sp. 1 TL-2023]